MSNPYVDPRLKKAIELVNEVAEDYRKNTLDSQQSGHVMNWGRGETHNTCHISIDVSYIPAAMAHQKDDVE